MTRPTKHPKTGVYRIRMGVPDSLRPVVGKRELIRSLGTKDGAEAKRLAPPVIAEFEQVLARARVGDPQLTPVGVAMPVAAAGPQLPAPQSAPSVPAPVITAATSEPCGPGLPARDLLTAWAAERGPAPNTLKAYSVSFRNVARVLGFDDVRRITPDDVARFKHHRLAVEKRDAGTVEDDVRNVGAVCRWGVRNRMLLANPFEGMAPKARRKLPPVHPYDDDEAKRILIAAREEVGWLRWAPWLLAFTGARIGELAELRRGDVRADGGVPILDIRPHELRAGKNEMMQRMLPLHPELLAEGFLAYVDSLPPDPGGPLFPMVKPDPHGKRDTPAQTQHRRWLRNVVGIKDPKKAPAHSWRHRMEDELRKVRAQAEIVDAITGRYNPRNAGDGYGRGFRRMPAEVLKELELVPSPVNTAKTPAAAELSTPPVPADPNSPALEAKLLALVHEWFEAQLDGAFKLFQSGAFAAAMIPEGTPHHEARLLDRNYTMRDAEQQLDLLSADFASGDYGTGREGARALVAQLGFAIPEQSQAFVALSRLAMVLLGEVEDARSRWGAGEDIFRPTLAQGAVSEVANLIARALAGEGQFVGSATP